MRRKPPEQNNLGGIGAVPAIKIITSPMTLDNGVRRSACLADATSIQTSDENRDRLDYSLYPRGLLVICDSHNITKITREPRYFARAISRARRSVDAWVRHTAFAAIIGK